MRRVPPAVPGGGGRADDPLLSHLSRGVHRSLVDPAGGVSGLQALRHWLEMAADGLKERPARHGYMHVHHCYDFPMVKFQSR